MTRVLVELLFMYRQFQLKKKTYFELLSPPPESGNECSNYSVEGAVLWMQEKNTRVNFPFNMPTSPWSRSVTLVLLRLIPIECVINAHDLAMTNCYPPGNVVQ